MLVAGMRRGWAEQLIEHGGRDARGARIAVGREASDRRQRSRRMRERSTGSGRRRSPRSASRPSCSSTAASPASCAGSSCPTRRSAASGSCPSRTPGDVWLDLEGHPFYETARGLEYLFGWCYRDEAGRGRYEALWGRDRDGERRAFEHFVDWVVERRRRYPGMHVYHYAAYERTALTRLMGEHGTREQEVDDVPARGGARRPLPRRQAGAPASVDSYSIKAIEKLYGFVRTADVAGGDESIVRFEEWIETGDDALLDDIERYNEEDCRSTVELHEWLLELRPPEMPWRAPPELSAAERGGRGARRRAGGARGAAARRSGGGLAAAPARSPRRLPPARAASRGGGSGFAGRSSTIRSSSRTAPRSAASRGTVDRPRSRTRATRTG